MPRPPCTTCNLPEAIREALHDVLRGDPGDPAATPPRPARSPLSAGKASAWLLQEHQVTIRPGTIGEHIRRGHGGLRQVEEGARPKRGGKVAPSAAKVSVPEAAASTLTAPHLDLPPVPMREDVAFINHLVSQVAAALIDVNDGVRRRVNAVPVEVMDTPTDEESTAGKEGRGRRQPIPLAGPTDADARYVTGTLSGIAQLLKVRHIILTGGKLGADKELGAEGLKKVMVALGLPPGPPPIAGDLPDPENDEDMLGYEAASPDPPIPAPPPSGPRAPVSPPPPTIVPLRQVVGVASSPWKPPTSGSGG